MTHDATISTPQDSAEGPEGAEATSLVAGSETVLRNLTTCKRKAGALLVNRDKPTQVIEPGCDAYICDRCGPIKTRKFAESVAWQLRQHERSRFITLTQAHPEWQGRRAEMKKLAYKVRKEGYDVEWAWTTEVGSKTGMIHVHATQWGDYLPQAVLQELWGVRVDIRAIKKDTGAVAGYMAKGAGAVTRYMAKGTTQDYQQWLELNGGRPIHTTRGFFEGIGIRGAWAALQAERGKKNDIDWAVLHGRSAEIYRLLKRSGHEGWQEQWAQTFRALDSSDTQASGRADNLGDVGGV